MNILFVDDHTIFREGVASFIQSDKQCDALFTAPDIAAARAILEKEKVDLVITDLNFPEESGFLLLDYLKAKETNIPVIILSMLDDLETIQATLQRGARGYITKSSGFAALSKAIEGVSAGDYHFDQQVLAKMAGCIISRSPGDLSSTSARKRLEPLSDRQKEIFLLMAKGGKMEAIAQELFISTKTVENHRTQIYRKLGVNDRLELHKLADELGLL